MTGTRTEEIIHFFIFYCTVSRVKLEVEQSYKVPSSPISHPIKQRDTTRHLDIYQKTFETKIKARANKNNLVNCFLPNWYDQIGVIS